MSLLQNERERIREEELVRLEVREELKRKNRARLILLAAVWFAVLTALALANPYFPH